MTKLKKKFSAQYLGMCVGKTRKSVIILQIKLIFSCRILLIHVNPIIHLYRNFLFSIFQSFAGCFDTTLLLISISTTRIDRLPIQRSTYVSNQTDPLQSKALQHIDCHFDKTFFFFTSNVIVFVSRKAVGLKKNGAVANPQPTENLCIG